MAVPLQRSSQTTEPESSQLTLIPSKYVSGTATSTSASNPFRQEYTKRPARDASENEQTSRYHPRNVVRPCTRSLEECLGLSDVVVSAVPSASYKVKTAWLKDGCICINVAADKNFEKDVREKVRPSSFSFLLKKTLVSPRCLKDVLTSRIGLQASLYMPTIGKVTIMMLLRNL